MAPEGGASHRMPGRVLLSDAGVDPVVIEDILGVLRTRYSTDDKVDAIAALLGIAPGYLPAGLCTLAQYSDSFDLS